MGRKKKEKPKEFFPEKPCAREGCEKLIPSPLLYCSSRCEDLVKGEDTTKFRHQRGEKKT